MARKSAHATRQPSSHAETPETESSGRARGGAGRGIWSGSISFGLLQIPISLHTAEDRSEELHFRMLHKQDLAPIRFERVSSATGEKVAYADIVKGYEVEPDTFVVLEKGDFEKANVKATQTIDIQDFVPADDIAPEFFETPYYVVPQKRATKAYVLLRRALAEKGAAAIATFVLRTKEHLCALLPVGDAIMLEMLRFGHELKDRSDMPLPGARDEEALSDRELKMAEQLISGMMTTWDPSRYRDRYYRDVMKMIEEKAKTGVAKERHAALRGTVANDVTDLLELLKKSVAAKGNAAASADEEVQTRSTGKRPGVQKAKPRAKNAKKTRVA